MSNLSNRYYIDPPCVVVRGKPSAALADKLEVDEKNRVEEQNKLLGDEGRRRAKEELEAAKAVHELPIPEDLIKSFPVPDVHSIAWIPVQSAQEGARNAIALRKLDNSPLKKHINADGSALPFFVEFDHVQVRIFLHRANVIY